MDPMWAYMSNLIEDLQNSIDNLFKYCSKWQLIVNILKKKFVFGKKPKSSINGCTVGLHFFFNELGPTD